jgi:hypothetical protein
MAGPGIWLIKASGVGEIISQGEQRTTPKIEILF